jgi:hypothetical protein
MLALLLALALALSLPQSTPVEKTLVGRHVIGLEDVKLDSNGLLFIENNEIHFDAGKSRDRIPIASIEDIFVGTELTQAGGKMGEIAKGAAMAAPYDSGAALTLLLQEKVDVLTITFRDSHNGLHAVIFALPKNQGTPFRDKLIAAGAPNNDPTAKRASNLYPGSEHADSTKPTPSASFRKLPVIIEPLGWDVQVPPAFRYAIYEALVDRIEDSGVFSTVYRSGDHRAESAKDLVTLYTDVDKFKQGNQTERITVMGATKITVTVTLSRNGGVIRQVYKVGATVRFFGENLGVTLDLAKRIAKLLSTTS